MAEKTPRPPLFPLALLLLALVAASALRPGRGEGAGALNGVYLVAPGGTPLDRAQLRAQGIRIVTTAAALRDAAATAEIVIVDREALPLVGDEWLAEQCRVGKLIVGIDVPILDLAERARFYQSGLGGYRTDHGGRHFYSMFFQVSAYGNHYAGAGSDAIYSTAGFLGFLRARAEGLHPSPPPPPPAHPATRPRPTSTVPR